MSPVAGKGMDGAAVAAAAMAAVALLCLQLPAVAQGQLQVGFYNSTCPTAESLVQQVVANAVANDSGIAAGLIRLHFHDCFVRGCDASVLIDTTANNTAEKDAAPNNPSLRGFSVIDAAKSAVEAACPNTVSCADILAFAARDSINITGNLPYQVPSGRRDGNVSLKSDAVNNLPQPGFNASQLVANFAAKNLTDEEMVILSGAHTIGRSFCTSFLTRIYNGTTPTVDSGLSSGYATLLQALCPSNTTLAATVTTVVDPTTPTVLDNNYYKLLPLNLGLFFSDNQLRVNSTLNDSVNSFAANETLWKEKFVTAMLKMGNIEVLTGSQGEIRLNCSIINNGSSSSSVAAPRRIETVAYSGSTGVSLDEIATS